jgi:hypothetical protein
VNCGVHPSQPASVWSGSLCKACFWRLRNGISELVFAYSWLRQCMVKYPQWGSERVGGTKEAPAPLRVQLLDQANVIGSLLSRIEKDLYKTINPSALLEERGHRILERSDALSRHPLIVEIVAAVNAVKTRAHALAPWRRGFIRLPVPCPTCNLLTLTLYDGDSWVTCRNPECEEIAMPHFRYDKWVKTLLEVHGDKLNGANHKSVRSTSTSRFKTFK